jgi:hypothetical protein
VRRLKEKYCEVRDGEGRRGKEGTGEEERFILRGKRET